MLSRKTKYAIKALIALAEHGRDAPVRIADLAREQQIPPKFLEAILLELRNQGILRSRKGKGGGISWPVIRAPSTWARSSGCSMARWHRSPAPARRPMSHAVTAATRRSCGVHLAMKEVRDATAKILDGTSLAQLLRQIDNASLVATS